MASIEPKYAKLAEPMLGAPSHRRRFLWTKRLLAATAVIAVGAAIFTFSWMIWAMMERSVRGSAADASVGVSASLAPAGGHAGAATVLQIPGLGSLRANVLEHADGSRTVEALNVPFAQPPVGALRFRPARPPVPWTHTLDATKLGPGCMQLNATIPISEDCLQLNIWAPLSSTPTPLSNLSVFVWACGGGLTTCSGRNFNGTHLAQLGNMVVVTINYRLGALGFYASSEQAHEDIATGGLNGVLDILHALRFVRDHIQPFGGAADRVTLGGESSGAVSSCILAFAPKARSLFARLVLESGACTGPWMGAHPTRRDSYDASELFAASLGCAKGSEDGLQSSEQSSVEGSVEGVAGVTGAGGVAGSKEGVGGYQRLACLRALPAEALLGSSQWAELNFGLDGYLLHDVPHNASMVFDGPLLLGGNSLDTTCAYNLETPPPSSYARLITKLATYFGDDAAEVAAPYVAAAHNETIGSDLTRDVAATIWLNMSRDVGVSCPSLWLARRVSHRGAPVYLYNFDFNATQPGKGVLHGDEVDIVWQRPPKHSVPSAAAVSRAVGTYWSSFINDGAPVVHSGLPDAGWPRTWPRFSPIGAHGKPAADDAYLEFGPSGDGIALQHFHHQMCDAWDAYLRQGELQRTRFGAFGYLC